MDPELLGLLIDRHADALTLYARQWCEEPEDVVQEAFVSLAGQRVAPESHAAWLFKAVRNGAINAGVARRRRQRRETEAAQCTPDWFEVDASSAIDPDSAQAALLTLPPRQREVIVAHLWGGLTFEQIAEVGGLSSSTAHRLYHAGLNALRERLGETCRSSPSRTTPS